MTRRFEYTDAKSNKFWEVTVKGKTVTVQYGRLGTDGQRQVKAHATPAEARAAAEKQVAEKVKKGYREVGGEADKGPKASATSSEKGPAGQPYVGALPGEVYARTKIGQRLFGGIVFFETNTQYFIVTNDSDEFEGDSGFPVSKGWRLPGSKKLIPNGDSGFTIGKYKDWRLPSVIELALMNKYINTPAMGNFSPGLHWSEDLYEDEPTTDYWGEMDTDTGDAVPCDFSNPAHFKVPDYQEYKRDVAKAKRRGTRLGRKVKYSDPDRGLAADRNCYSGASEMYIRLVRIEAKGSEAPTGGSRIHGTGAVRKK